MILIPTLISCPERKRQNWKRRLLKQLSVSKSSKVVSFKPPHNGPVISSHETFDLSPLQKAMREARQQGKDMRGFHCFPIRLWGNQRVYEALPFKILKELRVAVVQYEPTAPFTLEIVETLVSGPLPPVDWKAMAKACPSGGDYLLWRSEFQDRCFAQANRNWATQDPLCCPTTGRRRPMGKCATTAEFLQGILWILWLIRPGGDFLLWA
jgi:hypothetical protein